MSSESRELCISYLIKCKKAGKLIQGFPEMLTMFQLEVTNTGLTHDELKLLASVITKLSLGSPQRSSLIKCLIPVEKISEDIVEKIGLWFVANAKSLQIAPAMTVVHWLVGLMDYGLVEMKTINTFYYSFFYILTKNKKLEPYIARLIYVLTKPDDVSRRQVSRLLAVQSQYAKPRKHLTALLSLFKSYKPQHVPETIPTINIGSVWKPIPESLKLDLQEAAKRCSRQQSATAFQQNFVWNATTGKTRSGDMQEPLIPMIDYIKIGSSISKERKNSKSVFEIRTLEDLGKHQLSIELPCNSMSLLANEAGLHILTFASANYQGRFSYNLYNMLQNAFIYEVGKYSYAERDKLLFMTAQLTRYMHQEIILVSRFLQAYLMHWNTRDHRESIFALIQWITIPCFPDFYNKILVPLRTMWERSSVDVKCEILRTLENMITNLFIKQGFEETRSLGRPIFVGGGEFFELTEVLEPLMKFINDLIVSGLNIESNNNILLSAALTFYEQIVRLEERSDLPLWTIAPPAVIYGGFLSRSVATLSRVCALLLKYRDMNAKLREMRCRDLFEEKIKILDACAKDIAKGLWYNEVFVGPKDGYFLQHIPDSVLTDLKSTCALDTALDISNHWAILPYKYSLRDTGLQIHTKEDCLKVAEIYFPDVAKFLQVFKV